MKILWIPHTGWHIPQRAHLFCRTLSERHEVHVTDWVADFSSARDYLSRRYLRNFVYRRQMDENIVVHGVPRVSPALFFPLLRRLNAAVFSTVVRHIIERYGIDVAVGTFVVPPPVVPRLIFDMFDDNLAYWRSFGRWSQYADEIEEVEQAYLQVADAVVAVSPVLVDKALATGDSGSVHLIPNGVDLCRHQGADGARFRVKLGARGKSVIGVLGNHDKEGELTKVLDAAELCSDMNVTFVIAGRGKAVPDAQKRTQQKLLSNVKFVGYIPIEQAPEVIAAFDVGLCPYEKTPGAEVSSPVRLLMYAASGLPTVCTDLECVRQMRFPNVVLVQDSAESLADGIRHALQLPRERPPHIADYDLAHLARRYETVLGA
jgi:glycosyltransferase involved in cell wall biosynthesis